MYAECNRSFDIERVHPLPAVSEQWELYAPKQSIFNRRSLGSVQFCGLSHTPATGASAVGDFEFFPPAPNAGAGSENSVISVAKEVLAILLDTPGH